MWKAWAVRGLLRCELQELLDLRLAVKHALPTKTHGSAAMTMNECEVEGREALLARARAKELRMGGCDEC